MKLIDFLRRTNMNNSLLVGYYGGGNYGDELLLEVLGNLLIRQGTRGVTVTYQKPENYPAMHHDFGFRIVNIHDRLAVLKAALTSKKIMVGGGGLWGVDMNLNTLLLSMFLFMNRWVLMKKIYLLGVGCYSSTNKSGRWAAWLAGRAANVIIARDKESLKNFKKLNKNVHLDTDIAWNITNLDLTPYQKEAARLSRQMPIGSNTLVMAPRRPQSARQSDEFISYNKLVSWFIQANPGRPIILMMLESESKDPSIYQEARNLRRRHKHLRIIEAPYNPLALFLYIKAHSERLAFIAPQLHLIMSAHLTGTPFLPITYDNKVSQFFNQISVPARRRVALADVTCDDMQKFADKFFGGK